MPEFHSTAGDTIWREGGVRCVTVPSGVGTAVELRSDQGSVFLRKQAPTITAARNEAEYLRLLLQRDDAGSPASGLKPFALIVEDEQDTADAYPRSASLQWCPRADGAERTRCPSSRRGADSGPDHPGLSSARSPWPRSLPPVASESCHDAGADPRRHRVAAGQPGFWLL